MPAVAISAINFRAMAGAHGASLASPWLPREVLYMETLGNGLVILGNGAWETVSALASPLTLGLVLIIGGLAWMARLELDDVDRANSKPEIGIH